MGFMLRHQMVNVSDAAREGVFNRDHREVNFTGIQRIKHVFECIVGDRAHVGKDFAAGNFRIRTVCALKSYITSMLFIEYSVLVLFWPAFFALFRDPAAYQRPRGPCQQD